MEEKAQSEAKEQHDQQFSLVNTFSVVKTASNITIAVHLAAKCSCKAEFPFLRIKKLG